MSYQVGTIKTANEKPHITEVEARRIWAEAKTLRMRVFIKLLWFTGLRLNEVLALRAQDFRRDDTGYSLIVTRLKKKAKPEALPILNELADALDSYIKSEKLKDTARLFLGHENSYRYQLRACAKRARLDNWKQIHPHLFRHGFVYDKARKGVHPYILSKLVGHSSLGITLEYYQPTTDDLRKAIEETKG